MTTPDERARALRFAGEILREMRSRRDVPADLQQQAKLILRHYPDSKDLQQMIKDVDRQTRETLDNHWLSPENGNPRDVAC
jgi:hypothetical protein